VYPSDIRSYLGESYVDVYFGFEDDLPKDTYDVIIHIDEHTLRDGAFVMIPKKSKIFVAPEVWFLERNSEVTNVCPITKNLQIPKTQGAISMPLMFDLRTTRPVGELSIEGSFDSKGNGLGFDWQGNTL